MYLACENISFGIPVKALESACRACVLCSHIDLDVCVDFGAHTHCRRQK